MIRLQERSPDAPVSLIIIIVIIIIFIIRGVIIAVPRVMTAGAQGSTDTPVGAVPGHLGSELLDVLEHLQAAPAPLRVGLGGLPGARGARLGRGSGGGEVGGAGGGFRHSGVLGVLHPRAVVSAESRETHQLS